MTTTLIDSNTLSATLEAPRLTSTREGDLLVRNRGPAGNTVSSLPVTFTVGNPSPTITALTDVPEEVVVGDAAFGITVEGTGFEDGVVGRVNGIARPTTFVDETSFTMTVAAGDLTVAGTLAISALNPSPTEGPSNEQTITVLNPLAGLSSISPELIVALPDETSPPVSMTVVGSRFVDGAVVLLEGTEVPTQFVSSTTLSAEIPASLVPAGGPKRVTVQNPEPAVLRVPPSETLPLMIENPIPVLDSLSFSRAEFEDERPTRPDGEGQSFQAVLVLSGSNFNTSTKAFFDPPPCETFDAETGTLLNSNQMVFELTITCNGQWIVLMENAQPGGGESQTLTFLVGDTGLALGTVRSEGAVLSGVTVQLTGPVSGVIATGRAGGYAFADLPDGTYTLTALATGFEIAPASIEISIAGANSLSNDFTATLVVPEIESVTPPGILVNSADTDVVVAGGPFISSSSLSDFRRKSFVFNDSPFQLETVNTVI